MDSRKNAIVSMILENIEHGKYLPGSAIPSRNQLVKKYGVSYDTVDKALKLLIQQGCLTAERGHGTFVAQKKPDINGKINQIYVIFHSYGYFNKNLEPLFSGDLDNNVSITHLRDSEAEINMPNLMRHGVGVMWYYPFPYRINLMHSLNEAGVPQLLLNRDYEGFNCVTTDPDASLREGLLWLTSQAGRELSLIYGPHGLYAPYRAGRIIAAYENIMRLGGHLAPDNIYAVQTNNFTEEVPAIANRLFLKSSVTPGIVLLDIEMAMLLVSCGLSLGKHPGKDYHLLVFDHEPQLQLFPGIGMMSQMLQSFGYEAKKYFFAPSIDRTKTFRKFIKAELICT